MRLVQSRLTPGNSFLLTPGVWSTVDTQTWPLRVRGFVFHAYHLLHSSAVTMACFFVKMPSS